VSNRAPRPASARYNEPAFRRPALAPGLLGAVVLLAGLALLDSGAGFLWIRFPVAILALIVAWFAFQARHWWWLPPLLAIAVVWNPVYPLDLSGQLWVAGQFLAAGVFIAAGILIKVPVPEEERRR
jgi:hypothetical protein